MKEVERLEACVDDFCSEMKKKLIRKANEGYFGWRNVKEIPMFRSQLLRHVVRGDPVDVANFAMFLWYHKATTCEEDTYPH